MIKNAKPTLLVVDNTPETFDALKTILKDAYILRSMQSYEEAFAFLQTKSDIDLILLETIKSEPKGYALCKAFTQSPFYADVPVIAMSMFEENSDIIKGFECGAADYISKPFVEEIVKARIKAYTRLKEFRDTVLCEVEEKENLLCRQSRMTTLGEMFENVIHQFKQPLSIINVSCLSLKMSCELGKLDIDEVKSSIDTITAEADYLTHTINDFRDFTRNDTQKESLNFRALFKDALEILSFRLNKLDIEIIDNIESFRYHSYKNYIIQIIVNILNNAIDILQNIEGEKWIRAESRVHNDLFILKICDSGGGIRMDETASVFQKYVTTKEKNADAGLGLYMSQKIMQKKIGGDIDAYNEKAGACFELAFPIVREE